MSDGGEIVRIIFREERVAGAQRRIMDAKMFLEHLATPADREEPLARRGAATIVPAQVGSRLFAFENGGHARLFRLWPVSRYVSAITALRQADFHRAR